MDSGRKWLCLYFFLALASSALGEPAVAQVAPTLRLKVKEVVPVGAERIVGIVGPPKCDAQGNLYLCGYSADRPSSVVRISPDGKQVTRFTIDSVPGFEKEGDVRDYAVGLRGELYRLGFNAKGELGIIAFQSDGSYEFWAKLEGLHNARQIAFFQSGELLIRGTRLRQDGESTSEEVFTGIFDRRGRLLREVAMPSPQEGEVRNAADEEESGWLDLETVVQGDDGNVYLLRPGPKPMVYAVSPAEEVVRTIAVVPPQGHMQTNSIQVSGGRLLVWFSEIAGEATEGGQVVRMLFSLIDPSSGEKLVDYEALADIGAALACFTPNGFTFVGGSEGRLVIKQVAPE